MKIALLILAFIGPSLSSATSKSAKCEAALEVPALFDLKMFPEPPKSTGRSLKDLEQEKDWLGYRIGLREKKILEETLVLEDPDSSKYALGRAKSSILEDELTIESLKKQIADLDKLIEARTKKMPKKEDALVKAWQEIESKSALNPALASHFRNGLAAIWLQSFPSNSAVAVFAGIPGQPVPKAQFDHARKLIEQAVKKGYTVLIDGHAPMLSRMVAASGGKAVRIYTREVPNMEAPYILIDNTYLLLELLKSTSVKTYAMESSVWGVPLALFGGLTEWIGRVDYDDVIENWTKKTNKEYSMGLGFPHMPFHYMGESSAFFGTVSKPESETPFQKEQYSAEDLRRTVTFANGISPGFKLVQGPEAVVFGSGSLHKKSSPFVYQIAYELGRRGIGVATGGAGGAMLAANMGAWDAGAESIGIPITGRNSLATEKKTFNEYQTATVEARDYDERIPWLLSGRQIVVVAPGGKGTMREIAAALVELFSNPNAPAVVFLDKGYYGAFVEYVKKRLTGKLIDKIAIVDTVEEFSAWLDSGIASGTLKFNLPNELPAPRSDRKELPAELFEYKPKGSYIDSGTWSDSTDSTWDYLDGISDRGSEENL